MQTSGGSRRGNANARLKRRHCEERSDEAIHSFLPRRDGLLRGACHRAALCADPLARNDGEAFRLAGQTSPRHTRFELQKRGIKCHEY